MRMSDARLDVVTSARIYCSAVLLYDCCCSCCSCGCIVANDDDDEPLWMAEVLGSSNIVVVAWARAFLDWDRMQIRLKVLTSPKRDVVVSRDNEAERAGFDQCWLGPYWAPPFLPSSGWRPFIWFLLPLPTPEIGHWCSCSWCLSLFLVSQHKFLTIFAFLIRYFFVYVLHS